MSFDFFFKHNMHAVEWKLNKMLNKNPNLINKGSRSWRHPLKRKFKSYCVRIL